MGGAGPMRAGLVAVGLSIVAASAAGSVNAQQVGPSPPAVPPTPKASSSRSDVGASRAAGVPSQSPGKITEKAPGAANLVSTRDLARCAGIDNPVERLECFDMLVRREKLDKPKVEEHTAGKWSVRTARSPIDDSTTVTMSVDGDRDIKGWLKTYKPTLIVRCKEGRTEAYIVTGMPPNVEYGNHDGATATVRYDDAKAVQVSMGKSTDGEALFFSSAREHVQRMMKHRKMLFQFTPFNASPTFTTFDIEGLETSIAPLRNACRW